KLGRGSLSDVEWLVQLKQLEWAHSNPRVRNLGTLEALSELVALGAMDASDAERLEAAWLLTSRCRSALVLAVDKQLDVLPTDRKQLEALARILEYSPGSATAVEEDYLSATRKSRQVFERLFLA
ncbi:MAG: hypothetical protein RLZ65_19, partial [Actinomycetota bacterium]